MKLYTVLQMNYPPLIENPPGIIAVPEVGGINPTSIPMVVDFPAPLCPRRTVTCPWKRSMLRPATAIRFSPPVELLPYSLRRFLILMHLIFESSVNCCRNSAAIGSRYELLSIYCRSCAFDSAAGVSPSASDVRFVLSCSGLVRVTVTSSSSLCTDW